MQEFTRIIRSIHRTGILSANCFIVRVVFLKLEKELLKKETKVSENQVSLQIRIFVMTMCLCMCMYTHASAELYVR